MTAQKTIEAKDLRKTFGQVRALDHMNLDVAAGNIVGLIEPNGAGKSTLIRSLVGLNSPDSGSIRLFEHETPGSVQSRRRIGYMPQSMSVYQDLTVDENLVFFGRLNCLDGKKLDESSVYLLDILQLQPKRH